MKRFLLFVTLLLTCFQTNAQVPQSERDALITLYNSTNGTNWVNQNNWNTATPVSTWFGITTTVVNNQEHVTSINIGFNNLTGVLPSEIGNFPELVTLTLFGDNINQVISGNLPVEIGNLTKLELLNLSQNNFTGSIPSTIGNCTQLKTISLNRNQFSGSIPSEIGNLLALEVISIAGNNLSGSIPSELGNLTNLFSIGLSENLLSGIIPNNIGNLTNLQSFVVSNNFLDGSIPDLSSNPLNQLWINTNNFQFGDFENEFSSYQNINQFLYTPQRALPSKPNMTLNIGESTTINANVSGLANTYFWFKRDPNTGGGTLISNDENFTLTINNASDYGDYWLEVSNATVTNLLLTTPDFTVGPQPISHPDYNALVALYNSTNGQFWNNNSGWLDNDIPISNWFGITEVNGRVTEITMQGNGMFGPIPTEVSQLTMLQRFDVFNNFITESIPTEFGSLTNITWLDFRNNRLTGSIPQELTNLNNLFVMVASNNDLEGDVPDFTNLVTNGVLDFFWIENNKFTFADFEDEFSTYQASGAFVYSPQKFVETPDAFAANIGETVTLTATNTIGNQVTYNWNRINSDNTLTFLGSGNNINVAVNSQADYADYTFIATSTIVTGLELRREPITIGPDPSTHPDYDALIALHNALDGPNWTDPWDITAPIETWDTSFRLQFDPVTNRVTDFEYSGANLTGTIPPEVGDLTELRRLWFFGNNITGEIPAEIWSLTNLTELIIGSQQSSSAFTPGTMTLTNGIPQEIVNLQQLEWLNLNGVALTLPLQPELFNLPNLFRIRLQGCGIIGQLPTGLANISDVRVERNEFEGSIPAGILNSTGNARLALSGNYFDFSDLEPLVSAGNIQNLELSPQRTRDEAQTIDSAPGADITLNVNDTDIGRDNQDTAMNNLYQWYKNDVAISGADQNTYTIFNAQESDSGIYFCEITNSIVPDLVIRRADIELNIDATLTLEENNLESFKIYPNPVKNWLTLKLNTNSLDTVISIFDVNGKSIYQKNITTSIHAIDLSNLNTGVYILKIQNPKKSITKRLIKQ